MTTATQYFDFSNLTKDGAIELAKLLGLKRDWARAKLPEIKQMLRAFDTDKLLDAARRATEDQGETFDAADFLTDEKPADQAEQAEATEQVPTTKAHVTDDGDVEYFATPGPAAAPAAKAVPTHSPGAKPADVNHVANLLAQLLATGAVNQEQVEAIVETRMGAMAKGIGQAVGQDVRRIVDEAIAGMPAREIVVKSERAEVKITGRQHFNFETLLHVSAARQPDGHRLNVWLYGPPGTGKTTAARNVAKALSLPFHCNGAMSTKYELTGFIDAGGTCHSTEFRKAWENGGVYLFDEIDGSVPAAVVAFNAALANGVMAFPDKMIERHTDCVIIAAANTVHGATAEFTGRMKLDAATIDRFVMIEWPIDEVLERELSGNEKWAREVQAFRKKIADKGVKVAITPRATIYGASLLSQGLPMEAVRSLVLRKGMTDQQWAMCA